MASALITPRTLKGFRDFLPASMMQREHIIDIAKRVYRAYGYAPIDTPVLEYLEILTGKGSEETDRQMYRFEDNGGRAVGMRFDLTVPLARFCAQHAAQLGLPFKRYHIAPVWRGENTHRGRYREFMQCDFDTIGTESLMADIEVALVIHDLLRAIGIERFTIRVNNRQVLNGLLEQFGLRDASTPILRALDKLAKIGPEAVAEEMTQQSPATAEQAQQILALVQIQGSTDDILQQLFERAADQPLMHAGVTALQRVVEGARAAGVPDERLALDVSIARGLDYYTGTIYETFLDDLPGIGSICSGGRYDNLAGMYTKQQLPGIGASLGLDRLLAALEELHGAPQQRTPADVLVTYFSADHWSQYLGIAAGLRAQGLRVEMFPEPKKLGQQLKYADRQGFRFAVIAGEDEFAQGTCQLKDLGSGESIPLALDDQAQSLGQELLRRLSSAPSTAATH